MIAASRRWLKRNRTPIAIGASIVGLGYVATQYLVGKIVDARERMSSERIARENLRRRFQQNQEDSTFTVLALLPTVTENILEELKTENITTELQLQRAAKTARNIEAPQIEPPNEMPSVTDEDGRSMTSLHSESGIHASQMGLPPESSSVHGPQDGGEMVQKARRNKLRLWNDLKISAITRSFTLIYTLALLTLLTRIQLNLLGRRSYLASVFALASPGQNHSTINLENHDDDNSNQAYGNDSEVSRRYLTFSWWLLHRGWKDVMHKVEAAVNEVFGAMNIRDDLSMAKFSQLTLEVRKKIEGATEAKRHESKWLENLLPPQDQEDFVLRESGTATLETIPGPTSSSASSTILRRLLDETSDLIDTPPFTHVLTLLLDAGFSTLVDQKISQQVYKVPSTPQLPEQKVQEILDTKLVKLPILLAALTRQAYSIGSGESNEYLQSMDQVSDLEAFAAVVYSSNWENEIVSSHPGEKNQHDDLVIVPADVGCDHVLDSDTKATFESLWGKVIEGSEKR